MAEEDYKTKEYYSLKQAEYGFLKSMKVTKPTTPEEQDGTYIVFQFVSGKPDSQVLQLDCKGVRGLKIGSLEGKMSYLVDIRCMKDDQQEDLNYRVVENEHAAFSLLCKDFSARFIGKNRFYCSFCGKTKEEVQRLVAGPNVFICNECVSLSVGIMLDQAKPVKDK